MVLALAGIAVSNGIAIGQARLLARDCLDVRRIKLPPDAIQQEVERYRLAVETAARQLRAIRQRINTCVPTDAAAFIDTHLMMLGDTSLAEIPTSLIRNHGCNAEWALHTQRDSLLRVFDDMDDAYLRERREDVDNVINRIFRALKDNDLEIDSQLGDERNCIIVAQQLGPADVLLLHSEGVIGIITESGGPLSHTAILAKNLGIPAIVGAQSATRYLRNDDTVILDCNANTAWITSDTHIADDYRRNQQRQEKKSRARDAIRHKPAITTDGYRVTLQANIDTTANIAAIRNSGASGIGLYRTEFLHLGATEAPGEQEQFDNYAFVVRAMQGSPVTIRTMDLGSDKVKTKGNACNPALGLRGLRLSLSEPDTFVTQLRAILRASALGPIRLLLPMVTTVKEIEQVTRLLHQLRAELTRKGIPFDPHIPIGAMIEVPAAALSIPQLAPHLDFFSIGTNDLIQYTLAIDRIAEDIHYLYDPLHPGFLTLLKTVIDATRLAHRPVSLCGEMAGNVNYTRLLLGLGLRDFSMPPSALPEVKEAVLNTNIEATQHVIERIIMSPSPAESQELLERLNQMPMVRTKITQ